MPGGLYHLGRLKLSVNRDRKRFSPAGIIRNLYADNPQARQILLDHSRKVCRRALEIGHRLQAAGESVDLRFLAEAAMLHDIGMIFTDTPELHCHGNGPYIQHGIRGKELLEKMGLPRHARVCERHIGVGLSREDIEEQQLPLPARDMQPESLEEQIISYADLFYSKNKKNRHQVKSAQKVRASLRRYGQEKVKIFDHWHKLFESIDLSGQ